MAYSPISSGIHFEEKPTLCDQLLKYSAASKWVAFWPHFLIANNNKTYDAQVRSFIAYRSQVLWIIGWQMVNYVLNLYRWLIQVTHLRVYCILCLPGNSQMTLRAEMKGENGAQTRTSHRQLTPKGFHHLYLWLINMMCVGMTYSTFWKRKSTVIAVHVNLNFQRYNVVKINK